MAPSSLATTNPPGESVAPYMAIVGPAANTNVIPNPNASTALTMQTSLNVMAISFPREQTGRLDVTLRGLEVAWKTGTNELGEECAAGVDVTTDLVGEVPISGDAFAIEFTDTEGGDWQIEGRFWFFGALIARRTTRDGCCEPIYEVPMR